MKILISVDIEGVAGVYHRDQVIAGNPEYEEARRLMTQEANAAISGAFDGGATEVFVNDSHGRFRNLLAKDLDPRAAVIQGRPRVFGMSQGLELGVQGLCLVGYHSRAGGRGILAHTTSGSAFAEILYNGTPMGEAGIYGAVAGERGVPVILGCGDDVFIEENTPLFSDAEFAETKRALGFNAGVSLSPQKSCELIKSKATLAVQRCADIKPFKLQEFPLTVTIRTQTSAHADLFSGWPTLKRVDPRAVEYQADSAEEAMRIINCCSAMAASLL